MCQWSREGLGYIQRGYIHTSIAVIARYTGLAAGGAGSSLMELVVACLSPALLHPENKDKLIQ